MKTAAMNLFILLIYVNAADGKTLNRHYAAPFI